jgi:DUF4097 and DUF4098 domain-containing protein YvlB
MIVMKLTSFLLLLTALAAVAATEEQLNQRFTVESGGQLVVDVNFGSIDVVTHASAEVVVDVWRKITRKNKADEEEFLKDHPVTFSQDGNTVTVRCRRKGVGGWSWGGRSRMQGKYTITVPAQFDAQLKTSAGSIAVSDLAGEVKANTSGGGLRFAHLRGPLDGDTSGGGIHVTDCEGKLKIHTSGGGIDVRGGSGSLDGHTSGGSVVVKGFEGDARVGTSGGGLTIENVVGPVEGSTSGGSVSAVLPSPLPGNVKLSTSGGGVTVVVPAEAAFDLDASTSAGRVSSDLPVTVVGKVARDRLEGTVNGGGKSVVLRSSAGSIHLKKR